MKYGQNMKQGLPDRLVALTLSFSHQETIGSHGYVKFKCSSITKKSLTIPDLCAFDKDISTDVLGFRIKNMLPIIRTV